MSTFEKKYNYKGYVFSVVEHVIDDGSFILVKLIEDENLTACTFISNKDMCSIELYTKTKSLYKEIIKKIKDKDDTIIKECYKDFSINILGVAYNVKFRTSKEDEGLADKDGYCSYFDKQIVVCMDELDGFSNEVNKAFTDKVIRHEMIHAFLYESGHHGQDGWSTNEEIIDWIAIQHSKLVEAFKGYE